MRRALWVAVSAGLLTACGGGPRDLSIRQPTKSYWFVIKADTIPPFANEPVHYTVTVIDRATEQPIRNGQGQIYAQFVQGGRPYTWDGFTYGPEAGTYHANLRFVISGTWSMGLRFQRDSLSPLELTDWQQMIRPERDTRTTP